LERKFANHPGWKRILRHRFTHDFLDTLEFKGHITLYCMDAVTAPLVVHYFDREYCIVDAGYSWLKQFPAGEDHYTVTTHFDAAGQVVLWYIDICLHTGLDENQIPWIDDLYLDLVVSPAMEIEIKDADELRAALESGAISSAEFDLAWLEADKLMDRIAQNQFGLYALSCSHRQMLL
jgi:predicted RNA-binding protein associated with RNAse of E/G family